MSRCGVSLIISRKNNKNGRKSYARGDYKENSDIDVMILTTLSKEEIEKIENCIFDLAFDLELESRFVINPVWENEAHYKYWLGAMYEALMFLLIWYSVSTTLFQMIRSKIFISDCLVFFDTIATFTQTIAGWVVLTGKNMAQISDGISNPVIAGIVYWLIRILVCGGCLVGAGILVAFIGIKIAGLYKKYCWDMITVMVTLISMAIAIYFGDWIKTALSINMLLLLLFVQLVYVAIRWYVKGWRETRGYY